VTEDHQTRCYRYALLPSPRQEHAIFEAASDARTYWNALVATQRWAENELRHGRRGQLFKRLLELYSRKSAVGGGSAKAITKILSTHPNLSKEDALNLRRRQIVKELCEIHVTKSGYKARRFSARRLACAYAQLAVDDTRRRKGSPLTDAIASGLNAKWADVTKTYASGERGRPHFKRRGDNVSLQCQLSTGADPLSADRRTIDLARLIDGRCEKVPLVFHRPLPDAAEKKQLSVTIRGERMYVVLMIRAPASSFALNFPKTFRTLGIDPGLRTAITAATASGDFIRKVNPPGRRDRHFLKLARRLGRKLDRQRRANNPDCYQEDGTVIRGMRPKNTGNSMRRTLGRLSEIGRHLTDARRDAYHNAAHQFLRSFDTIGIGTWRPPRTREKGKNSTAQTRGIRRKGLDNAISEFFGIAKDKAARSTNPKRVKGEPEPGTTRDCPDCGAPAGPSGIENLHIRKWICGACGTIHDRDSASARTLARRCENAAGSAPGACSIQRQRDRQKRSQTKERLTSLEVRRKVPVADESADREIANLNNSHMILCESCIDVPCLGEFRASLGPAANEFTTLSAAVADISSREPLADVSAHAQREDITTRLSEWSGRERGHCDRPLCGSPEWSGARARSCGYAYGSLCGSSHSGQRDERGFATA
jgi:transposase